MPEYPRSPFEKTGTSITPSVDGDALDATVIGETTQASGSFTTLKASTDPVSAEGVGDRGFNDARYALESNNLSDLDSTSAAFGNIKQPATESATGVIEKATTGEVVTGTDTDRAVTPAGMTARMEAPGSIGETTPASGNFTTLDVSGQVQGDIINNLNAFDFGERIMELSTDLAFLNVLCNDPSGGADSYVDISTKGHHGTPVGLWTSGDRIKQGRAWVLDPDGDNDYINLGDSDDFSFGDGSNDSPFTMFGMIEVRDGITNRCIFSKWDETTASKAREYLIFLGSTEKLSVFIKDESVGVECIRTTNDSLSIGNHSFVVTYDGVGGGTAANGITIYINGIAVASTATNDASYVAMENFTVPLWIGSWRNSAGQANSFVEDDFGCLGIDDAEWSAMTAWRFHQLCLVNYSENGIGL